MSPGSTPSALALVFSTEEVNQFDDQNDHHHQFQDEAATLVKFVDQKAIQSFGGSKFFIDKVFVLRNSYLGGGQPVKARREHVTHKLDGGVGALHQLGHLDGHGVEPGGLTAHTPAPPEASPMFQRCVDTSQFAGQQLVVMAELQQLRVDVLQDLHRSFGARRCVINQRGIPSNHDQVVGIVGKTGLQNVIVLTARERGQLAAQYLRNLWPVVGQQIGAERLPGDTAQGENVIIFAEPFAV